MDKWAAPKPKVVIGKGERWVSRQIPSNEFASAGLLPRLSPQLFELLLIHAISPNSGVKKPHQCGIGLLDGYLITT
ncbi:hypothetical protein VN23_09200 [Janthinobacterium sp. B9-8]|nr:hypothetical protein VN23_09200 [Janthinobacterium sp. B9-8]